MPRSEDADFPLLTPMLVMRVETFQAQGRIPRSDEALAKALLEEYAAPSIAVFISHQWWKGDHPDYTEGSKTHLKFRTVVHGVKRLIAKFVLDRRQVCIYVYMCILSIHIFTHVDMHAHIHIYVYTDTHCSIYTRTHTCIHTYICIHI